MRLLIADFDHQDIVSKQEVIGAVRRLPKSHYAGIQAIRYDPKRTLATMVSALMNRPSSPHTNGFFYQDHEYGLSVIVLFRFSSREEFYHILYHEIGHFVFLKVLLQSQRDAWFSLRRGETRTVSRQARKNAREDFAETYSFYCTRPSRLASVPRKRAFFRESVFQGQTLEPIFP
jgi:hypothetical protein